MIVEDDSKKMCSQYAAYFPVTYTKTLAYFFPQKMFQNPKSHNRIINYCFSLIFFLLWQKSMSKVILGEKSFH